MKTIRNLFAALLLTSGVTANASTTFDFVSMANSGEKGFSVLSLTGAGFTLDITGTKVGDPVAFAYLDANHGGLGVCGNLTTALQCTPSNDDNVTTGEVLILTFNNAVTIDSIWFNNNHDGDGTLLGNKIKIGGTDYALVAATGVPSYNDDWKPSASFSVAAGGSLLVTLASTNAEQFYISGMTVTAAIPEPETYAMLLAGLGLLGFAARRRKLKEAAAA
jgi:PEP-CTERM motif